MESGFARTVVSERERAERLAAAFARTADVLERSAGLAEEHAERCAQLGRHDEAGSERQAAERARDGAQRARDRLELLRGLYERERLASERDRRGDERERVADQRERVADEPEWVAGACERAAADVESRRYDDRVMGSSGARNRSKEALRQADEALAYARAGLRRLAAERQAPEEKR